MAFLISKWFAFLTILTSTVAQDCLTTSDSVDARQKCIFPFTFKGKTYTGCPEDLLEKERRWCSTLVNSTGHHVTGQGKYGFCSRDCPKYHPKAQSIFRGGPLQQKQIDCRTIGGPVGPGSQCQLPFIFQGTTYFGCPVDLVDNTKTWCSTKIDENGVHVSGQGAYGFCSSTCPKHVEDQAPIDVPTTCSNSAEECRPTVQCAFQFTPNELRSKMCKQADGSTGTCCQAITEIESNGPELAKPSLGLRRVQDGTFISSNSIRRAADKGQSFAQNVTRRANFGKVKGRFSANFQHALNQRASPGIEKFNQAALSLAFTALELENEIETRRIEGSSFTNVDLQDTVLQKVCGERGTICDRRSKYRTIDGSCNNLRVPNFGRSFTPLQRILDPDFGDNFMLPREDQSGRDLPSARLVSTLTRFNQDEEDQQFSAILFSFGQFIDHDLDHVPITESGGEIIECCTSEGQLVKASSLTLEERAVCFPIEIPRGDSLARDGRSCINFVRAVSGPSLDCQPGPLFPLNQITHWLDSSNVYGSTPEISEALRTFENGLLDTIIGQDGQEQLPIDPHEDCVGPTETCGLAGDLRPNENAALGSMHVLFVREHNRVARALKEFNPRWRDEKLYQEAKRIVNAQWQHIIYNEWLPIFLGSRFLKTFGLQPLTRGFSQTYRDDFDPRVTTEFAGAAFRVGHTFIVDVIRTISAITSQARQVLDLQDTFSDGDLIRRPNLVDEIIKGLTLQAVQSYDNNFVDDVTDHLFDDDEMGFDLIALNIQRAREFGIPGYIHYREICGLGRVNSFDDLRSNIPADRIDNLRKAYQSVEDIDLFIGAIQELATEEDSLVGSTFLCLIGDVFARMRFGDRFFYDNENQAGSFTEDQLNQIRRTSLARIICDNTKIEEIQPMAFRQVDSLTNRLTRCTSRLFLRGIPSVDLSVFG